MKRIRFLRHGVFILLLFLFGTFLLLPVNAAESNWNSDGELNYDYGKILDLLPEDAQNLLPSGLSESDDANDVLDSIDSNYLWSLCTRLAKDGLSGGLQLFASLLGLIVVSSVLSRLGALFLSDKSAVFEFAILLISALQIYTSVYHLFDLTRTVVEQINQYMNALIAALCGIYLLSGNSGVALAGSTWMGLLLAVSEKLCYTIFFPLMQISFGGTLISSASPELNLRPILGFLRKICTTLLVLFMTVITLILSFQTSLAAAADSLSIRGIKFAASNMIPMIGGLFSDTVRTLSTSLSLLKNTVGLVGVLGLVTSLLAPLAALFAARYSLSLATTAADLLEASGLKPVLEEADRLVGFLIGILLLFGVFYLILLGVLVQTAGALG